MVSIQGAKHHLVEQGKVNNGCSEKKSDMKKKRDNYSNRTATNKYWCSIFAVAFSIWLSAFLYVFVRRTVLKIDTDKSALAKYNFLSASSVFGQNWIFDAITCNLAFFNDHYQNNGSIVILINLLICGSLILYSLSSMRKDAMFCSCLGFAGTVFVALTIVYRVIAYLSTVYKGFIIAPVHEKLPFWFMPDVIFVMILYIKRLHSIDNIRDFRKEIHPFDELKIHTSATHVILVFLIGSMSLTLYILDGLNNNLFYVIVGCSIYIYLVLIYFVLMVLSCTIELTIDNDSFISPGLGPFIKTLWHAFIIIGRYHFGTACYHATLIFPRVETLFLTIYDWELKKLSGFSQIVDRLYLTHWKLHNLSLVTTVLQGSCHLKSMEKLICTFSNDLPKLDYFQSFSKITRSSLAFLISTNSLMLISLWSLGMNDPLFSSSTWVLYICAVLMSSIYFKLYDVAFDTIRFCMNQVVIDRPVKRWVFTGKSFIK